MTGAGGVGGLLWLNNHQSTFEGKTLPTGVQLRRLRQQRERGRAREIHRRFGDRPLPLRPFAEPIRASGPMAKANPVRFSTKYTDYQSGLVYYGYRYYGPAIGRWLDPDRIAERGGLNLYAVLQNHCLASIDPLGEGDFIWRSPKEVDGKHPGRGGYAVWESSRPKARSTRVAAAMP
jgi:RHS repeat-associated protein